MPITDFTYKSYSKLIQNIVNKDYSFVTYQGHENTKRPCILRHDIDSCLQKAYNLAVLENSWGVKATYFVLLKTDFYNVFSKNALEILTEILNIGHEIGLHFDEKSYEGIEREELFKEMVYEEINILSVLLKNPVKVVSMHRPSKQTLDANYAFDNIENSYSHKYFKEYKYVSDSRMHWREDIESIINS